MLTGNLSSKTMRALSEGAGQWLVGDLGVTFRKLLWC